MLFFLLVVLAFVVGFFEGCMAGSRDGLAILLPTLRREADFTFSQWTDTVSRFALVVLIWLSGGGWVMSPSG